VPKLKPLVPAPKRSRRIYLRIDRDQIGMFRFLLEAHDNLALFTVVNPAQNLIMLRFSPDAEAEARQFLRDAARLHGLEIVGPNPGGRGKPPL
jgi:hypothetical protein